jgi:hypothetical protein
MPSQDVGHGFLVSLQAWISAKWAGAATLKFLYRASRPVAGNFKVEELRQKH